MRKNSLVLVGAVMFCSYNLSGMDIGEETFLSSKKDVLNECFEKKSLILSDSSSSTEISSEVENFLKNPVIKIKESVYPVYLSDKLKEKLENGELLEKLNNKKEEIKKIDYSFFPVEISGFDMYLSDDGNNIYSALLEDSDW